MFHLTSPGLDLGTIGCASVADYIAGAPQAAAVEQQDEASTGTERSAAQQRRAALGALGARVDAQIHALAGNSAAFHAGLDFALLTLPQWPALTLQQAWWLLHRGTVQRSLLDYRNAIDRALTVPLD